MEITELLEKLLELTKKQSVMIDKEDLDGLDLILSERRGLIDILAAHPGRAEKTGDRNVTALLDEISALEAQNTDKMRSIMDTLSVDMRKVQKGRKVVSGYDQISSSVGSTYFDKIK